MRYKLSLHSHLADIDHLIFTKPNHKPYLELILNYLIKMKGNLVLGVSNFDDDDRYETIVGESKRLSQRFKVNYEFKEYFISIKYKNKNIHLIKTDEIETKEGHILLIGHKGKVKTHSLVGLLKKARKERDIVIANHPLHTFGLGYFLIKHLFRKRSAISISAQDIDKNKKSISALELNSYFQEDWKSINALSKKLGIPLVSDSDAHFTDELFRSYYVVDGLSFKNVLAFKKTLKKALKKHMILHARKHGCFASYRHALSVLLIEIIGIKLGLVKRNVL